MYAPRKISLRANEKSHFRRFSELYLLTNIL
nr:MAG TPA: Ferritin-like protein [Caudoviricetes sp.]